jgi:precorrin-6B methylase 2
MGQLIRTIKHVLLPTSREYRRVRAGVAAGCWLPLSYQSDLRMMWGMFERPLIPWVRKFFQDAHVAYDIGNAEGYYTLAFLRLCAPGGRVIAFEANPVANREFRVTMERNTIAARVQLIEAFVGDGSDGKTISVDATKSDRGLPPPDVVKIDVEGAEVRVLRGMEKTLRGGHPPVILEVHSKELEQQSLEMLQGWDYHTEVVDFTLMEKVYSEYRPLPHNRWIVARGK